MILSFAIWFIAGAVFIGLALASRRRTRRLAYKKRLEEIAATHWPRPKRRRSPTTPPTRLTFRD